MTSPIQAAIEQRRVTIAGARLRDRLICITPDEAEAVANLLEAVDAYWNSKGGTVDGLRLRRNADALAEAITHRSTT